LAEFFAYTGGGVGDDEDLVILDLRLDTVVLNEVGKGK